MKKKIYKVVSHKFHVLIRCFYLTRKPNYFPATSLQNFAMINKRKRLTAPTKWSAYIKKMVTELISQMKNGDIASHQIISCDAIWACFRQKCNAVWFGKMLHHIFAVWFGYISNNTNPTQEHS